MFVIAALFTGVYMSAQGFYRFAATDTASCAAQVMLEASHASAGSRCGL